jgi:HK97 family phage major capsid protein
MGMTPETVGDLIIRPVSLASRLFLVSTVVTTQSKDYRLPIVAADPSAAFVAEGQEIPVTDADVQELIVTPAKVAGLTVVSRELANDSNPEATDVVGDGLGRDIAKKVDAAGFGTSTANGPAGLRALSGATEIDATGPLDNLDVFTEAISEAENVGAQLTSFVASPAVALALAQLKTGTGYNTPLLGSDPTNPTQRLVQGVPLIVSPAVGDDVIWGIPKAFSYVVLRDDEVPIAVDKSAFFTSDRIAVRATLRVSWGWPHPAAIQKIVLSDSS